MSAPLLQPLGTPATEWAQQTGTSYPPQREHQTCDRRSRKPDHGPQRQRYCSASHSTHQLMGIRFKLGTTGGCLLSLITLLVSQLFDTNNLAGFVGTFDFFITPGDLAGAPIVGLVLSAAGGNWHAPISYTGGVQVSAVLVMACARLKRRAVLFAKL
ncbi:hypothetical protein FRC12_005259 [Ceratobasidium sp. 428]|nr:hypothetical protein FRC12_005259 [Ceratobasidium sp. 428]